MESAKYQGLQPTQTSSRFDRKVPRNLPLLDQFAFNSNYKTTMIQHRRKILILVSVITFFFGCADLNRKVDITQ